jgi:hypothetical protein
VDEPAEGSGRTSFCFRVIPSVSAKRRRTLAPDDLQAYRAVPPSLLQCAER